MSVPANCCGDPLEAPCGWGGDGWVLAFRRDSPLPPGCLLSLDQDEPLTDLPADIFLEVRCRCPESFRPAHPGRSWSLWLEFLQLGISDDLHVLEQVLESAAAAGCTLVVAPGLAGPQHYRYRLYSLIRLLCDQGKQKFAICEPGEVPLCDRLNHYLASQRGCCRHPRLKAG